MKVAPEGRPAEGKTSVISQKSVYSGPGSLSRPETQESRFTIEKVDDTGHNGISIGAVFISNNCNTILLVMALIFIVGGIIFTAISYRPQDPDEDMEQYRERQLSKGALQVKRINISILTCSNFYGFWYKSSADYKRVISNVGKYYFGQLMYN